MVRLASAASSLGRSGVSRLRAILSHPLLLLLVGGALTGYLIPSITRQWQDRAHAIDVKGGLVKSANEAESRYFGSVQLIELRGGDPTLRSLHSAYVKFAVRWRTLAGQIQTYFPENDELIGRWLDFQNGIAGVYYTLVNDTPRTRRAAYNEWRQWINSKATYVDYPTLITDSLRHIPKREIGAYDATLAAIRLDLDDKLYTLDRMILAAQVAH